MTRPALPVPRWDHLLPAGKSYQIRIDGQVRAYYDMFSRADMAFYGFSSRDVTPPVGYYVTFDAPGNEPQWTKNTTVGSLDRWGRDPEGVAS